MSSKQGNNFNHVKSLLLLLLTLSMMSTIFLPALVTGVSSHKVYAGDAPPYGAFLYHKSMSDVPRIRYPVGQYYGKRSGELDYADDFNTVYDDGESREWSPFMDAYSKGKGGIAKRPFMFPSSPRLRQMKKHLKTSK